jgi:hypothetical protein
VPRDAALFEEAGGSPLRGYLLLKKSGGNVPPMWIERAKESRKKLESEVAKALTHGPIAQLPRIEEWETRYEKECFYRGIRILFELERNGKSRL